MVATAETRPNTYRRFEAACERATAKGIRVLAYRDGRAIVSASNGRDAYMTDGHTCSCRAAIEGDPICLHRAALSMHLATIETPEPTPPAPAAPAVYRECPSCGSRNGRRQACVSCKTTGMVAAA